MEVVGVQAVVEGLASFSSDMGKVNGILDSLRPKATALMRAFDSIGDSINRFAESILRVVEYALGKLLADAIEFVIGKLKDLVAEALEAAGAFQILSLRLQGMNLQTLVDSGMEYTEAMKQATAATKEDLTWVMKLAAVTPYDATDIANVFTLARSYGFASEESKRLTESTMNFAAGMGLGSEALERIIVNFGQMVQRGKITTREMNDLARGSMLPLADVLQRVADNMGIDVKELTKMIQTVDGVPADEFIKAFEEMTEGEVRFSGAAERMARTFKGASENVRQTIRDLLGFYVIKPVLDVIGARLASIMDAIVDPKRWKKLTDTLSGIGTALGDIVTAVLGLVPSADTLADNLISGLEGFRNWLEQNKPGIITFFEKLREIALQLFPNLQLGAIQTPRIQPITFKGISETQELPSDFGKGLLGSIQKIADFITDTLIPAFDSFKKWLADNKPLIDEFFKTLGDIASTVFQGLIAPLTGGEKGEPAKPFLESVKGFMQWVIDNKDEIAKDVEVILKLVGAFVVISTISTLVFTVLIDLLTLILTSPVTTVLALISLLGALGAVAILDPSSMKSFIDSLTRWIGSTTVASTETATTWVENLIKGIESKASDITDSAFNAADTWIKGFCKKIADKADEIKTTIIDTLKNLTGIDASGEDIGKALMEGLARGIENGVSIVLGAIETFCSTLLASIMTALGISSPSTITEGQGEDLVNGLVLGIENATDLVIGAFDTLIDSILAKIGERAGEIWTQLSTPPATLGNIIGAGLNILIPSPTLEEGETGAAAEAGTNAGNSLMDAMLAAIRERASEIWTQFSGVPATLGETLISGFQLIFPVSAEGETGAAAEAGTSAGNSLMDAMLADIRERASEIWTQLGKPESIKELIPSIGIIISTASLVTQAQTAADDFVTGFCGRITQKVSDIKTAILDTVKGLTGIDLTGENVGKQLIDGMARGIEKGTSVLLGAITTLVNKIIQTIISLLQIGSPSRVTEEFGENISGGLARGISNFSGMVVDAMENAVMPVIQVTRDTLDLHSPSGVFEDIGKNIVSGMAAGIQDFSGMVTEAMANVVLPTMEMPTMAGAYTPAQAVSNTSYQTSNAFNLNIQTNARTEPIIADFGMMQSLMGG